MLQTQLLRVALGSLRARNRERLTVGCCDGDGTISGAHKCATVVGVVEGVSSVALNVEHAADFLRSRSAGDLLAPDISGAGEARESDALRSEFFD